MALLHYHNLDVQHPDTLMRNAFYGLKTCSDFLNMTKRYTESDVAVKRLAWEPGPGITEQPRSGDDGSFWIRLTEPADRKNEPESTFQDFLNEDVKDVVEADGLQQEAGTSRPTTHNFSKQRRIIVIDRDPETYQLLLERKPKHAAILLKPNTWVLQCQIRALRELQNSPSQMHVPLLRLFQEHKFARWPEVFPTTIASNRWMALTDAQREGTDDQRNFVKIALATPDFAFLEGPPGSGKTTAICELLLQLARQGKRALLCASTHVAVDNVLERLMDERNKHRDLMIPIRVGDRRSVSKKAQPWQLEEFVVTERERLLRHLRQTRSPSTSQSALESMLKDRSSTSIQRLVLDAANLVCGTTIGILQHPDIKRRDHSAPVFDVLIVDEASKTTFQEFLVPALLAKRWIIVGDPKQLSPYVEQEAMAVNIDACLQDEGIRNACIDTFISGHEQFRRQRTTVAALSPKGFEVYAAQTKARNVRLASPSDNSVNLATAELIAGELSELSRVSDKLPLDVSVIRAPEGELQSLRRQADAWTNAQRYREAAPSWSKEIAWRLVQQYDQRLAGATNDLGNCTTAKRLKEQIEELLPDESTGISPDTVMSAIQKVRRVALPSVLEALQNGFERETEKQRHTAFTDGLPPSELSQRHILLRVQHRMHSDIAEFSHQQIYHAEALFTPGKLNQKRVWGYEYYKHRALWLDVRGQFNRQTNSNELEASTLMNELRQFDQWAENNLREDGQPWEVAVLTFYRGQEKQIRKQLRNWTSNKHAMGHFQRGNKSSPHTTIALCTIDRFQGHEADLVFISIARPHPTAFLETPNRLNVALTRARYQRVVIGNRTGMFDARAKKDGSPQRSLLAELAANEKWESMELQP